MAGIRLQTSCTLCQDEFSDARRLECNHAFCTKCLVVYIKSNVDSRSGKFKCNDCDTLHDAPRPVNTNSVHRSFPESEQRKTRSLCTVKTHENQEVILYCTDHETPICAHCVLKTHKKCRHADLTEISLVHQKVMKTLAKSINSYIADLRHLTQVSDKYFKEMKDCAAQMKLKIKENTKRIKAKLDAEERNLLSKVDEIIESTNEDGVKSAQKKQEDAALKLYIAVNNVSQSKSQLEKEWSQLIDTQVPSFRHEHIMAASKMDGELVGQVQSHTKATSLVVDIPQSAEKKVISLQGIDKVAGITNVNNYILITRWNQSYIEVYNSKDLKLVTRFHVSNLKNPYPGLIVIEDGSYVKLAVGDRDKALHFVSVTEDWKIKRHQRKQLMYKPERLSLDIENKLIIILDDINKRIYTYSTTGTDLISLQLDKRLFCEPRCAVKLGSKFVVADSGKKQVVWLDEQGQTVTVYKGTDQIPLEFPLHLAVDRKHTHILIVDLDAHCVQEVDYDGNYIRTIVSKTDGITSPRRADASDDGRLCIAYDEHREKKLAIIEYEEVTKSNMLNVLETCKTTKLTLNS